MNQTTPPQTLPAMPAVMAGMAAPAADIVPPAEAKFWADWAAKAPALLRSNGVENLEKLQQSASAYKVGSVALGAAIGVATVTKYIPGKWKYLSGAATAASLLFASVMGGMQDVGSRTKYQILAYADALERNPALQQQLAHHLSFTVTADMAASGIEKAVLNQTAALALQPAQFQTNVAALMDARSNASSQNCVPCR